jgi:hypothetical protein
MYFKFDNKKAALGFCLEVNKGENIIVSEENVTTGYAQPFEFKGTFYVLADEVTSKYTDMEAIDLFAPIDTTPPTPTYKGVIIPEKYSWVFTNNRFELNNFVVEFQTVNNDLVVDTSYIFWEAFKTELDKPENITVKASLMPIWDYVVQQIIIDNTIDL